MARRSAGTPASDVYPSASLPAAERASAAEAAASAPAGAPVHGWPTSMCSTLWPAASRAAAQRITWRRSQHAALARRRQLRRSAHLHHEKRRDGAARAGRRHAPRGGPAGGNAWPATSRCVSAAQRGLRARRAQRTHRGAASAASAIEGAARRGQLQAARWSVQPARLGLCQRAAAVARRRACVRLSRGPSGDVPGSAQAPLRRTGTPAAPSARRARPGGGVCGQGGLSVRRQTCAPARARAAPAQRSAASPRQRCTLWCPRDASRHGDGRRAAGCA
jgi:hypothetical protein